MRVDKLMVYVPQDKQPEEPIERLQRLARKADRPINYLALQAIIQYVERAGRAEARAKG